MAINHYSYTHTTVYIQVIQLTLTVVIFLQLALIVGVMTFPNVTKLSGCKSLNWPSIAPLWSPKICYERRWATLSDVDRHWGTLSDVDRRWGTLRDVERRWATLRVQQFCFQTRHWRSAENITVCYNWICICAAAKSRSSISLYAVYPVVTKVATSHHAATTQPPQPLSHH